MIFSWENLTKERPTLCHRTEIRWLLEHLLGIPWASFLARKDGVDVSQRKYDEIQGSLARLNQGEPLAYLLGFTEFSGHVFRVNSETLIPRPETETLVRKMVHELPNHSMRVVDWGTGSGAIAVSLALEKPNWKIVAADVNPEALKVAQYNAQSLGVCLEWHEGSWENPWPWNALDVVVANPPYLCSSDTLLENSSLRYEPRLALDGGGGGLDSYQSIVTFAKMCLNEGGSCWFEHGFEQGSDVAKILGQHGFVQINTIKDLNGHDRITWAYNSSDD